jgi:hypothetical protein
VTTGADRGRLSETLWPAVLGAVFFGPTLEACDVLLFGEGWSWGGTAARSVFYAVGFALFSVIALRFSATARERADVGRAVSTGVLPEEADAGWRRRLVVERHRLRTNRTGVPGVAVLVAVLVAVVTLLPDGPGGRGWLLTVGLALVGGLLTVRERSRLRTVERLLGELGPPQGPPQAPSRGSPRAREG